jgi:Protease II
MIKEPQAPRIAEKITLGFNKNEYRGNEELLINPSIETIDYYNWLRDEKKSKKYLNDENNYFNNIMKDTKNVQEKLHNKFNSEYLLNGKIKLKKYNKSSKFLYFFCDNYYRIKICDIKEYNIFVDQKVLFEKKINLLLDVKEISENEKFCQIKKVLPNHNDTIIAYIIDKIGNEEYDIEFKNIENNKIYEIKLPHKITEYYIWSPVENAIFYVHRKKEKNYQLWYLNIDTKENILIFEEKNVNNFIKLTKSSDKKYLFLYSIGENVNKCYYYRFCKEKIERPKMKKFIKKKIGFEYFLSSYKNHFIMITNKNSKNFKLMCVSKKNTDTKNWFNLIENDKNSNIEYFLTLKNYLIFLTQKNGLKNIGIINLKEKINKNKIKNVKYVDFPREIVYDLDIELHIDDNKFIINYSSYIIPKIYYEYNLETNNIEIMYEYKLNNYNPNLYAMKLVNVPSHDNVNIPLSIVYKKEFGELKNKTRPFLLSTYGSYGTINSCDFHYDIINLLDHSIVFAKAHVRGGGELGETWHKDGKKYNKINSIIDFITCSEYLIDNNYTTSDLLAIEGTSAGGLIVSSCMVLRPELYKLVIARVPVIDLINTLSDYKIPYTIGGWNEYGNPNIKKDLMFMKQYAPYNNIQNIDYPHSLIMTGFHDGRVPYWEAAKFMAKLRHMKTDKNIHLLYTNMYCGHFLGMSEINNMSHHVLIYAFILKIFNL